MKRALIVLGHPGIGKTTTCKALYQTIEHSLYIDADDLWRIYPFTVSNENKRMVENNIKAVYQSFLDNPTLETFIFSWVIPHPDLFKRIKEWFNQTENNFFLLTCDSAHYRQRLINDKRDLSHLENEQSLRDNYSKMDTHQINTTHLSIVEVVNSIQKHIKQ
jgi:phosphoribosylformylglycinamidine (FGAM) synthase PurS component